MKFSPKATYGSSHLHHNQYFLDLNSLARFSLNTDWCNYQGMTAVFKDLEGKKLLVVKWQKKGKELVEFSPKYRVLPFEVIRTLFHMLSFLKHQYYQHIMMCLFQIHLISRDQMDFIYLWQNFWHVYKSKERTFLKTTKVVNV